MSADRCGSERPPGSSYAEGAVCQMHAGHHGQHNQYSPWAESWPAAPASPAGGPATGGEAPRSSPYARHAAAINAEIARLTDALAAAERARDEATARAERAEAYIRKLFPRPTGATIRCGPVGEPTTLTPEQVEQITRAVDALAAAEAPR